MENNRRAILIANDQFERPGLANLRAPLNDVRSLSKILQDTRYGGFETVLLLNESSQKISRVVERFFSRSLPQDLTLLYYSGHGLTDSIGNLYFTAYDTDPELRRSTTLSANFLTGCMSESRSHRQIVILDCCFSGAAGKNASSRFHTAADLQSQIGGIGRVILSSSNFIELSFEDYATLSTPPMSHFTRSIIDAIQDPSVDINKDGLVSVDELYIYIYSKMKVIGVRQHPVKWALGVVGDIYISKSSGFSGEHPKLKSLESTALPSLSVSPLHKTPEPIVLLQIEDKQGLKAYLETRGCRVFVSNGVESALTFLKYERPPVAIIDSTFPAKDYFLLLDEVIALGIPLVILLYENSPRHAAYAEQMGVKCLFRPKVTNEEIYLFLASSYADR